jgi:hypothetical protein
LNPRPFFSVFPDTSYRSASGLLNVFLFNFSSSRINHHFIFHFLFPDLSYIFFFIPGFIVAPLQKSVQTTSTGNSGVIGIATPRTEGANVLTSSYMVSFASRLNATEHIQVYLLPQTRLHLCLHLRL